MLKKIAVFVGVFSVLLSTLVLSGCSSNKAVSSTDVEKDKVKVIVSFNPLAEFAKAVGGDRVQVETIIPNGTEPHDFEPKPKDLVSLSKAKVFIYNGLGMESWAKQSVEAANNKDLIVVEASKGCSTIKNQDEDEIKEHGEYDPHTWMSLSMAKIEANNIKDALVKVDSKNKEYYEKNYNDFSSKLDSMLSDYKNKFNGISNRSFITGHSAFAYLCRDFNLKQESIEGVFAEGEPTPKKMKELIEFCKKNNVKTIFMEDMVSPKVSQTLAKEVNGKVEKISTIESSEENKDYIQIMNENLDKIYQSLK